ncbi:MAG TPA: hypothetical protein DCS09_05705 [Porphyromonadaceae bacterium]|nr:hypothetical protein [Porphyromonadaceae bacterium]
MTEAHLSEMTDFEMRANNIAVAISDARSRVEAFGYLHESPDEVVSRIVGMFICWLTACEEARLQNMNADATFRTAVIDALPAVDDPNWDTYIMPKPSSSLKQRAEALWGIRIAFTHADGDTNLISNPTNKAFAQNAHLHIPGVILEKSGRLNLSGCNTHTPIKCIVQIRAVLP